MNSEVKSTFLIGTADGNLKSRDYFSVALSTGQAMQFVLGVASRAPGCTSPAASRATACRWASR